MSLSIVQVFGFNQHLRGFHSGPYEAALSSDVTLSFRDVGNGWVADATDCTVLMFAVMVVARKCLVRHVAFETVPALCHPSWRHNGSQWSIIH